MIRLLYTEISALPDVARLSSCLPDSFLQAYRAAHPKASVAGLGALWLAAKGGADGSLAYDEKGRPSLTGGTCNDLSISHTDRLVFCALAFGEHKRIGLDAEDGGRLDERTMERIAQRFFAPAEQAALRESSGKKEAFLELWTKKEAYAKYRGDGLAAVLSEKETEKEFEGSGRFFSEIVAGTRVAICTDSPSDGSFPVAERVDFFVKHG